MKEKIRDILISIEEKNNIKILFAIENGSRVWRMASKDSDYDIRFVFSQPIEEYVQIETPKNVISYSYNENFIPCQPNQAVLDISGFDIFKYIRLLASSNPTAIEWLLSDIIYYGEQNQNLKSFILNNFNALALFHHYKSICKNHYGIVKSGSKITYKIYLYAFRGLINAKWVSNTNSIPPINFLDAVNNSKDFIPADIINKLTEIIEIKSQGKEKDNIKNIVFLDNFIEDFLENNSNLPFKRKMENFDFLNKELRNIVLNN